MYSSDENKIIEFCINVYLQHEKYGHVVLESVQVDQLNFYLKSNSSSYNLSFPVSDTLIIYSEENIIEYVHNPHPIVRVRKQLVTLFDKFNLVDLQGKATLIWENGEYISTREYYSMKVTLYTMPGFLVELFYNSYLNKIERIEVLSDPKKLNKHLDQIGIDDLINPF